MNKAIIRETGCPTGLCLSFPAFRAIPGLSLVLLLAVALLSGCGGKSERAEQSSRLDSLETSLKQVESVLADATPQDVMESSAWCKEQLGRMHSLFQENPLAVEEKLLLDFEQLSLHLGRLSADLTSIENEIKFARQKINEWRVSTEDKSASPEDFMQYYQQQQSALRNSHQFIEGKRAEWETYKEQIKGMKDQVKKTLKSKS